VHLFAIVALGLIDGIDGESSSSGSGGSAPPLVAAPVATSPNGVNWTIRQSPSSYYAAVASDGAGRLVAGGTSLDLSTDDGATWAVELALPFNGFVGSIVWTGVNFVAVGADDNGGRVWTSPDGSAWTAQASGDLPNAGDQWFIVDWDGSRVVAVGQMAGTDYLAYSDDDGVTWTPCDISALSPGIYPTNLVAGGPLWVMGSGVVGTFATSVDGATWVEHVGAPVTPSFFDGVWNGAKYIGGVNTGVLTNPDVDSSADGLTWTDADTVPILGMIPLAVAWDGAQFVMVGVDGATGNNGLGASSPDGSTWTQQALPTGTGWVDVTWSGTSWIAVGIPAP
jgi:hypothetical protein